MTSAGRADLASLHDALTERERRAAATVHQLREQIAILTTHLAHAEAELADLATTRRTLTTLTAPPPPTTADQPPPDTAPAGPSPDGNHDGASTPAASSTTAGAGGTAPGSPTYTQILDLFTPGASKRAKDLCLALGLDPIPRNTEGLRAKLKRLTTRGTLHEPSPGLFTLAPEPDQA